jgi:copper(I)-binding protein
VNAEPVMTRDHSARSGPRVSPRVVRALGVATAAVLLTSACAAGQEAQTAYQKSSIDGTNRSVGQIDLRGLAVQAPPSLQKSYQPGTDAFLTVVLVNNSGSADQLTGVTTSAAGGWSAFAKQDDAYAVQQAAGAQATGSPVPAPSSSTPMPSSSTPTSPVASSPASSTGSGESSGSESASPTNSPTTPASSTPAALPTGSQSVSIPARGRASFGTPDATGGLLLTGFTRRVFPGTTVRITFTFARAGSVTVSVPVQLAQVGRTAEITGSTEDAG